MAQFYAEIRGGGGLASRTGAKSAGIKGHIRGWNVGVRVIGRHNLETGKDVFDVYRTGGSANAGEQEHIITVE